MLSAILVCFIKQPPFKKPMVCVCFIFRISDVLLKSLTKFICNRIWRRNMERKIHFFSLNYLFFLLINLSVKHFACMQWVTILQKMEVTMLWACNCFKGRSLCNDHVNQGREGRYIYKYCMNRHIQHLTN